MSGSVVGAGAPGDAVVTEPCSGNTTFIGVPEGAAPLVQAAFLPFAAVLKLSEVQHETNSFDGCGEAVRSFVGNFRAGCPGVQVPRRLVIIARPAGLFAQDEHGSDGFIAGSAPPRTGCRGP